MQRINCNASAMQPRQESPPSRSGTTLMRASFVLVLAACAHGQLAAGSRSSQALADATHSLLDAYDRGDARAFEAATEPSFVRFDSGKLHDRRSELTNLKARPPDVTRTWKDEHVVVRATDATSVKQWRLYRKRRRW